jgi:hypothetical protein
MRKLVAVHAGDARIVEIEPELVVVEYASGDMPPSDVAKLLDTKAAADVLVAQTEKKPTRMQKRVLP